MSYDYPPPPPQKKPRGCLFYGCLFSVILLIVGIIAIVGTAYFGYRYAVNTVKEYTQTTPVKLPPATLPEPERVALRERFKAFKEALDAEKATEPIILTADDLNALIDDNPDFKGRAHVEIEGEKIKGDISFPLSLIPIAPKELASRYLNGSATFRASLQNGALVVLIDSIETMGKPLPKEFVKAIEKENIVAKATDDPASRSVLNKLESLVVKDGKIILTPRPPAKPAETPPAPAGDAAKDAAPKDAAPKDADGTAKPKDAPAPKDVPSAAPG
ncbi:MAG: hypothetical protein JWN86_4730 [Planctomycetota bacterium]|nr:hypothetical protein [Planctomycetota bacterium]